MSIIRRLFTVCLLAIFAPSTVLAAAPMVICTGTDGKQAIESVHVSSAHAHQASKTVSAAHNESAKIASDDSDCRDSAPLSGQLQTRRGGETKFSVMDGVAILAASIWDEPKLQVVSDVGCLRHPFRQDQIDPRLIELSSTVLLN